MGCSSIARKDLAIQDELPANQMEFEDVFKIDQHCLDYRELHFSQNVRMFTRISVIITIPMNPLYMNKGLRPMKVCTFQ